MHLAVSFLLQSPAIFVVYFNPKTTRFSSGHRHSLGFSGLFWLLQMSLTLPPGITAAAVRRSPFSMSRGIVLSWNPPSGSVKIAFVVSQGDTVLLKAFNFMTCIVNFFGLSSLCLFM